MNENTSVTIDGKEYLVDGLSDQAKAQVINLRVVDEEIRKIEQQLAIYRTARGAYARALKGELNKATAGH
ncbi:DUF6447 family protein [Nitrobacter sp.]|uniref:DUF6447 family protein n=1 Tax=Nitrobacter sp. TaxID=29420 RepID=UPI003220891D